MNNVELLLGLDTETITAIPEGEVEIPRLSRLTGKPFKVTVTALSGRQLDRLKDLSTNKHGEAQEFEFQLLICSKAIKDPDLSNADLLAKFGAATPKDLVEKLFSRSGEVREIARKVLRLSGLLQDEDELSFEDEAKN